MDGAAMGEWPWHWWNVLLTMLIMAANAITIMFDMQLHAAKYNGACHLPPRWNVMKYWAALACYSGMVQPRLAWHWGGSGLCLAKAVSIPGCPELCRPNGMASNTRRHSHQCDAIWRHALCKLFMFIAGPSVQQQCEPWAAWYQCCQCGVIWVAEGHGIGDTDGPSGMVLHCGGTILCHQMEYSPIAMR